VPGPGKARYIARLASTGEDLRRAQALRYRCFIDAAHDGLDHDSFDPLCQHILVEEAATGALVCCVRLLPLAGGGQIDGSYSAQFYNLSRLAQFCGPMAEVGRFCVAPQCDDPDIVRTAWGAMTRIVDDKGIELLFGCSSFQGTDAAPYLGVFETLHQRYLAPAQWLPEVKAPQVVRFGAQPAPKAAPNVTGSAMPPLLRSYLLMGGWVSDHAVVDRKMNTLHVFTGLEIRAVPPARARLLRALADQPAGPVTYPE